MDKWLACDILIAGAGQANIATAHFIPDYESEKKARNSGRSSQIGYQGP